MEEMTLRPSERGTQFLSTPVPFGKGLDCGEAWRGSETNVLFRNFPSKALNMQPDVLVNKKANEHYGQ